MTDFQVKNDPVMRPVTDTLREALRRLQEHAIGITSATQRDVYINEWLNLVQSALDLRSHPDFAALIAEPTSGTSGQSSSDMVLPAQYHCARCGYATEDAEAATQHARTAHPPLPVLSRETVETALEFLTPAALCPCEYCRAGDALRAYLTALDQQEPRR